MKNQRLIWIIALIVIVLIFGGGLWLFILQYINNEEGEEPIDNAFNEKKVYCETYGATAGNFSDECANHCSYERGYQRVCFMALTIGCSCSEGNCWNETEKRCEPIDNGSLNANIPFEESKLEFY